MRALLRLLAVALATVSCLTLLGPAAPVAAGGGPDCNAMPSGPSGPSSSDRVYVCRLYVDLLERSSVPSTQEVDYWVARLQSGPRAAVTHAFERSDENFNLLIDLAYEDFLGRTPDPGGRAAWLDRLRRGAPIELVDAAILSSAEGFGEQGGTNAAFVDSLYAFHLDRTPSDAEVAFWADRIVAKGNNAGARFQVTLEVVVSAESRNLTADSLYSYWLGRAADAGGLAYWADQLARRGFLATEADFVAQPEVYQALVA